MIQGYMDLVSNNIQLKANLCGLHTGEEVNYTTIKHGEAFIVFLKSLYL